MKQVIAFTIILVSLSGCGKQLPEFPEVWRCTYSWRFQKFRCKNSKTNATENRRLDDSRMEGAEGTPHDDALEIQGWIDDVIAIARQRCN